MDISFIFKIAAIGIIVAVLNMVLIRSGREEQAMLTTLAGVIVVLMMIIPIAAILKIKLISIYPPISARLLLNSLFLSREHILFYNELYNIADNNLLIF